VNYGGVAHVSHDTRGRILRPAARDARVFKSDKNKIHSSDSTAAVSVSHKPAARLTCSTRAYSAVLYAELSHSPLVVKYRMAQKRTMATVHRTGIKYFRTHSAAT